MIYSPRVTRRPQHRRAIRLRRGVASLFAMLYMLIFSTLAIGFYSAVTLSVQVAHNDERIQGAQMAAESGLTWVKFYLSRVRVPSNLPDNKLLDEVYLDLARLTLNSENLGGREIRYDGATIHIPDETGLIPLLESESGNGSAFRAKITGAGQGRVLVTVVAYYRGVVIRRAVEQTFECILPPNNLFDFGVVSRGPLRMVGNGSITGPDTNEAKVLTTSYDGPAVRMNGNATLGGKLHLVNPDGQVITSGNVSIGGENSSWGREANTVRGTPMPEFPTVDNAAFLQYATNRYVRGQTVYRNVLIPSNTNPTFSSNVTVEGVLYIKYPNQVKFSGQATIKGVIVTEPPPTPTSSSSSQLSFAGGVQATEMPDDPTLPAGLRELKGSSILAPGFAVEFAGHSGVNGGSMIADSFSFVGGSNATIKGHLISLGTKEFTMTGGSNINRSKGDRLPSGLIFQKTLRVIPTSYFEVLAD